MVPTAHRVRTSLAIGAAAAALTTALLLSPRTGRDTRALAPADNGDGISLAARLATSKILTGPHDEDIAVTIVPPADRAHARPPVSLAVVIDRSGSMEGPPLENAKASAMRLIDQLAPSDAFTVITYSSSAERVIAMGTATDARKAEARGEIAKIYDDGGTCISCGLELGAHELAVSPVAKQLSRMVLISDGEANIGVSDRGELAALVARTARDGISISTVGVGLDFDEVTMSQLAQVGRGNYYFVENTDQLGAMFANELAGLGQTLATNVQLTVTAVGEVQILEAYGYPRIERVGETVTVPIADLRGGEARKVVLHVRFPAQSTGELAIAQVGLRYHSVAANATHQLATQAQAQVVTDGAEVEASLDREAATAIAQARSARALEDATIEYQRGGYRAARQVLDDQLPVLRARAQAIGAGDLVKQLDSVQAETMNGFGAAPDGGGQKASKTAREHAYQLAR